MDSSDIESDTQILELNEDDHRNQNISYEVGTVLGTKRLHLDSESSVDNEVSTFSGYMSSKRIKMENTSEDETEASSGLIQELGDEDGMMLGSAASGAGDLPFVNENPDEDGCILIHHMDIKEPLSMLKKSLEETHSIDLNGYEFYLQDTTLLAGHKNLVEQCVQGCGTVQINLELKVAEDGTKKINIIDVLKPSDSYLLATGNPAFSPAVPEVEGTTAPGEEGPGDKNLIRWVVDHNFKASQQRLQIPEDPMKWEVPHVRHWLLWAVRQFNLTGINLADWKISGATLCNLNLEGFRARVPYDPADIFWTHLELLRRCKFVAVMQNPGEVLQQEASPNKENDDQVVDKNIMRGREKKAKATTYNGMVVEQNGIPLMSMRSGSVGTNGQVQLWQFLLDLLTDKNHREVIQWLGAEGEFKLMEPERVAQLWGQRKNKPSMNYEKLSRALRYYYDGDMIAKVHGKRFVYKFVCDLKKLLGYSAFELNRLVIEAQMKVQNALDDPLQHSIFGNRVLNNCKDDL